MQTFHNHPACMLHFLLSVHRWYVRCMPPLQRTCNMLLLFCHNCERVSDNPLTTAHQQTATCDTSVHLHVVLPTMQGGPAQHHAC